jgi:hypothetical protein
MCGGYLMKNEAERIFAIRKRLEHIRGALFKMSGWIEEINMMLYKCERE